MIGGYDKDHIIIATVAILLEYSYQNNLKSTLKAWFLLLPVVFFREWMYTQ